MVWRICTRTKWKNLHAAYNAEMGHPDAEDEKKNEQVEARLKSLDVKEHVEALFLIDNNLSEDFKVKATIFETAVKSKIREEIARLEEEYKSELIEEVTDVRSFTHRKSRQLLKLCCRRVDERKRTCA